MNLLSRNRNRKGTASAPEREDERWQMVDLEVAQRRDPLSVGAGDGARLRRRRRSRS
jgi:hypothetical protein